ncbi:MAG: hypothetical protein ACK5LL_09885 [Suipraeoptans sp.]
MVTAIFIFLIGFGVMGLFWLQAKGSYIGERGFFYWRAATWGDGLCLSLLVGALHAYKVALGDINVKWKKVSYILGAVAGIVGAAVQASWVISDATEPNWTIEPHRFEPAGWYHAAYFVLMFFVITVLLVQVFFARRKLEQNNMLNNHEIMHMTLLILIWFSGLAYLFMHNIDDVYTSENYMLKTAGTFVLFIIGAFLFCCFSSSKSSIDKAEKSNKESIIMDVRCIIIGSIGALGFGLSIYYGESDYVTAVMCATLSIIFVNPILEKPLLTLLNVLLVVLSTFLLTFATLGSNDITHTIILAIITAFMPILIVPKGTKYKLIGTLAIILFLAPNIISAVSIEMDEISALVNTIVSIIIFVICSLYIPRIFRDSVIFAENRTKNDKSKGEVIRAIYVSYIMMFFVTIASVGMIVKSLYVAFSGYISSSTQLDFRYFVSNKNIILFGILTVSICILICMGLIKKFHSRVGKIVSVCLLFISYISIILNLIDLKIPQFTKANNFLFFLSGWIILWTSLFVANGFYDNIIRIRGIDKKNAKLARISSILIFCGSFMTCLLTAYSIDTSEVSTASVPRFLLGIIVVICCTTILPTLCCKIISFPRNTDMNITQNSPTSGVMHVGFLMIFPVIVGVLSVLLVASWVSASLIEARNVYTGILIINFLISCFTLVSGIAVALVFCLKNNATHLAKRINENANKLNSGTPLYELSCHLRRQNIMVLFMLAPYLIIPFIIYFMVKYVTSDNDLKKTWHTLVSQYIPSKYCKD